MTEKKRLANEDFSDVWKDNKNTLTSGLKLDLVEHLSRQRLTQVWVYAKERVIKIMKLDQFDNSQEIKILDIEYGLGIHLMLVAEEGGRLGKTFSIIGLDQNTTMLEEEEKTLEGGVGNIYSPDEVLIQTYDAILPIKRDGGTAICLQFMLPKMNFEIKSSNPIAFLQSGYFLASQDKYEVKV
ncbi:unnamed protein product [Rotaria sp. Silwood2]|nr:unnamed protein product [Rotaria sp. Silwood2]CAF2521242.1 unnamed protein product [Rotaria sp. Silwood2]CAF4322225.1 unnamed protein product [Rotaria sp. Silwood2]CAF4459134.1 unnamed protein product [Rotaria sp. Silwood2]